MKPFLYSSSVYSCHLFLISSVSVRSIPFISFIEPIFVWNVPLVSLIFLKRSLVFPSLLFSSISLHWSLRKAFLSFLAILWNSEFRCLYLSFSSLLFVSHLFTAICVPRQKTLHMDITRWSTPKSDWLYFLQPKMEKLYTVSKNKTRSRLWLRSWTPYCRIQKKVGKTTRPFRYDLNQISYDYTVEVGNRFKGLDLIDRVPMNRWKFVTLYRRQGSRPSLWKINAKKQNGRLGRSYK